MKRNSRLAIGTLVVVGAFGALVASSIGSNTLRAVPVSELRAADNTPQTFVGQRLRVVGFVGQSPVRKSPRETAAGLVSVSHFGVSEKGATLAVEYADALPDTFRAGGPVQVDGVYAAPGVVRADHVLTKCPSKYDVNADQEAKSRGKAAPVAAKSASLAAPMTGAAAS